jgi:hypothetical protein
MSRASGSGPLSGNLMSALEALEFIDWFRAAFAGWRFLFSSTYRAQKRERWRQERVWYVVGEVTCGLAGIVFSLVVVWFLVALLAGWDWLQRVFGT